MKINRYFILTIATIISTFMLFSCGQNRKADFEKVANLEKKYGATVYSDFAKAKELIAAYDEFVKKYPKDTVSARFLFEAGRLSMNTNQGKDAVKYFDKVITDFPDYKKKPDCMFLKGFVYDELLKDLAKAKEAYLAFVAKYPSHELVDDAKASIDNLGKTPEQLIKEFEAKNKIDSLQAKK